MYKVLLVDDEFWICQGLRTIVDWASLDMEVAASADNAVTALQLCEQETPDIIITDINMPVINGLEMIERLNGLCPKAVIIIISGHDEFAYARKAVSLHVFDYLLKPIDLDDLMDVLKRARDSLSKQLAERMPPEPERVTERDKEALTCWTVNRILCGLLKKEQLSPLQAKVIQDVEYLYNCVALVEVDRPPEQPDSFLLSSYEWLTGELEAVAEKYERTLLLPRNGDAYYTSYYICLFHEDERALRDMMSRCIAHLRAVMRESKQVVTIAYGEVQHSVYKIAHSAKQANIACQKRFIYGKGQVFQYQLAGEPKWDISKALESIQYGEIAENVIFNNPTDYDALFTDIRELARAAGEDSYAYLHGIVQNLEIRLLEELNKLPFGAEFQFNPFSATHQILQSGMLDDILVSLRTQLEELAAKIAARQKNETNTYIQKAIHYLNNHYQESDLNLKSVAKAANMSVSYFCGKFKLVTGESCISYLTDIRMKRAKELLADTDMKVHEIASYVGYENSTYFCTAFKKSVGYTPESFREHVRKSKSPMS